jgi:hypothetical protein
MRRFVAWYLYSDRAGEASGNVSRHGLYMSATSGVGAEPGKKVAGVKTQVALNIHILETDIYLYYIIYTTIKRANMLRIH